MAHNVRKNNTCDSTEVQRKIASRKFFQKIRVRESAQISEGELPTPFLRKLANSDFLKKFCRCNFSLSLCIFSAIHELRPNIHNQCLACF